VLDLRGPVLRAARPQALKAWIPENFCAWRRWEWTMICLAMGILGENEREYLQDDLKAVAV
jgi:hypothetical protein